MLPLFRRCCSRARDVSIWSFRGRSPSSRPDHADHYRLNFGRGSNATCFNERHVLDLQSVNFLKPSHKSTFQSKMEISEDSELVDAAVSVGNAYEVGQMIAEALSKVGHKGVVTLEEGRRAENSFYAVEGMQFDRGDITPYFATDSKKMAVEYENCKLLIVDNKITNARGLNNILEGALRGGYPIFELEALATLVVNKLRGSPKIAALKAPGFGDCKSQYLDDIAILTGGTVIREVVRHTLDNVGKEVVGHTSKVVLTKYTSTIVGDGSTLEAVNKRVAQIKNLIEAAEQDYEKEKLRERIANLSGGFAVIQFGAQTETELKEKELRAEDFLNTTMIVVDKAIVVGEECILLRLASKVDADKNALDNDEEKVGEVNVKRALGYPLKLIAINAGVNGSVVSEKVVPSNKFKYGYNAAMRNQKILCRSYSTARFMDCYEARSEGLLKVDAIRYCRDIICCCLNRLERGIMHASFDPNAVSYNGVSYSLSDGSDPIIPTRVGQKGGLYMLLEYVLEFQGNNPHFVGDEPELAILFFNRLEHFKSAQMLRQLLGDIYLMGKKLRVRSICSLVQSFRNFAPTGKAYYYNATVAPTFWQLCLGRKSNGYFRKIYVIDQLNKISDRKIRVILRNVYNSEQQMYSKNNVSSCIICMRHSFEHCNQRNLGIYPFWLQLNPDEVIHGLNEAFHVIYPDIQRFLNANASILEVDPNLFFGF